MDKSKSLPKILNSKNKLTTSSEKPYEKRSSNDLSTAKYNFTWYEKKVLLRIVQMMQILNSGGTLTDGFAIRLNEINEKVCTIPVSALLSGEKDKNYSRIKNALKSLLDKKIIYEDGAEWSAYTLIKDPKIKKYKRTIEFGLPAHVHEALLCFSQGFKRQYDITRALTFRSKFTLRFYDLLSQMESKTLYTLDDMKTKFQLGIAYDRNPSDIIKRVLLPAQKELNINSPISFEFEIVRTKTKPNRKIVGFNITPTKQEYAEGIKTQINQSTKAINPPKPTKPKAKQIKKAPTATKPKKPKSKAQSSQPITPPEITPITPITEPESKNKESWVKRMFKRLLGKK